MPRRLSRSVLLAASAACGLAQLVPGLPPGLASGLASLVGISPASAQTTVSPLLNQFITPDIYGRGVEPGVTVASRTRTDYDSPGVRAGSFVIRPLVTESLGYESNVLGTAAPHGSPVIETNASIAAASDWSRNSLRAALNIDDVRYPSQSLQSYTNWTASLDGTYEIGRDVLSAGYSHFNLNQTALELNTPQVSKPLPYVIDTGRLTYRIDLSRFAVTPGVEVAKYSFGSGSVLGSSFQQNYRDRTVVTPGVTVGYELSPRRNLVLVVRDAIASYSSSAPGQARRDYNDLSILGGLDYEATGAVRFRLLAGYEVRQFNAAQYKSIQAPVVEASAIWTPTGLTTVTGTLARRIEDATDETTAGYTETSVQLRVDHEYLRNVLLRANVGYYRDDYNQGGGSQTLWATGAGATYLLNRNMQVGLSYDFYARQSGGANAGTTVVTTTSGTQVTNFGAGYTDHRIMLQLRFAL